MFLPHEASMILGIPLSLRKPPDRVVWAHTLSGEFSTSSISFWLLLPQSTMQEVLQGSLKNNFGRRFKMIFERNSLRLLLGDRGIDGIPSTLGVLFNLCHTSAPRQATSFKATNSAGIGVIAQNWCGEAVRAVAMTIPLSTSVVDLEALACRKAILFAAELGLHRVIF
nr:hypothetical protein CFP56_13844 [Quercus suber]